MSVLTVALAASAAQAQEFAFVPRSAADAVDIVSLQDRAVVATVAVGDLPVAVAVHPDGRRAYVANAGDDSVSVVDASTASVVATIPVGDEPRHLALSPDAMELWVGNRDGASISIVATATGTVVGSVGGLGSVGAIAFHPDGTHAWAGSGNDVVRIAREGVVDATVPVGGTTQGLAVAPQGDYVYVARNTGGANTVAIVDTATLAVSASSVVGANQWGLAFDPSGRFAYVAANNQLRVIRASTQGAFATITLPDGQGATGVSADPEGHFVYVSNRLTGNLHVVSTATHQIVDSIAVGGAPQALGSIVAQPLVGQGSVAAGAAHACRLRGGSGTLSCWGRNDDSQAVSPRGMRFRAIAAGGSATCAIDAGPGSGLSCWGADRNGQLDAPNGQFVAVSLGAEHGCAIRAAGSVACWGANDAGQSTAPVATQRFARISAGARHSCGVRTTGEIQCWGDDSQGQASPVAPAAGESYIDVVTGADFSCGLQTDGAVTCWGNPANGRSTAPAGAFVAITAGAGAEGACARGFDGAATCWGSHPSGADEVPDGLAMHVAGTSFGCGMGELGALQCWGDNTFNQAPQFDLTPAALPDATVGEEYFAAIGVEVTNPGAIGGYLAGFAIGVVEGALPPGVDVAFDGLRGTPTVPGTYTFTLRGEDANGFHAEREYTLVVN